MTTSHKILSLESTTEILERHRQSGQTVALCHGVYDLLHPGHFRHLQEAKSRADLLVVTITADRFVGKGPGRPAFPQSLRAESLAALEAVDYVSIVEHPTALPAIQAVRPNFYVKGEDYASESDDVTGNISHEREAVEMLGGEVVFTRDITFSSSTLINTFFPRHSQSTQAWLNDLRDEIGAEAVLQWIDRISEVKVMVVGETILDVYTECQTLGKASKEPVLCLNRGQSVEHPGGALAVAAHCAGLGATTSLVTGINSRDSDSRQLERLRNMRVSIDLIPTDPRPTIRKERLIDTQTQVRVLELYEMDDEPLGEPAQGYLLESISKGLRRNSMALVADYGHGLISESATQILSNSDAFLAVNVQTNAGNHGFNSVSRYGRVDFATLNGNEARLEVRRRHVNLDDYIPTLREQLSASSILVTQGADGLDLYLSDGSVSRSPALAPFVKDRVGAGDAVLSITALLAQIGAPPRVVGFLGNLVGAWAVSFLGNERHLRASELKRQVTALLK